MSGKRSQARAAVIRAQRWQNSIQPEHSYRLGGQRHVDILVENLVPTLLFQVNWRACYAESFPTVKPQSCYAG